MGRIAARDKLPLVVIVAFLAGSLPFWALHKATRWRMRRKLDNAERALAAVTPTAYTPVATTVVPPPGTTTALTPDTPITGSDPTRP